MDRATKRLVADLKKLKSEPLIGANAEPFDDNFFKWYGIVVGCKGTEYEGIPIRFCLEFPKDYPMSPPFAYFETYIRYTNGSQTVDSQGRNAVCLSLFGNFASQHSEWKSGDSWTPAFNVTTILLSIQALMMQDMLSTDENDIAQAKASAEKFVCPITKHQGSDPALWFPQVKLE